MRKWIIVLISAALLSCGSGVEKTQEVDKNSITILSTGNVGSVKVTYFTMDGDMNNGRKQCVLAQEIGIDQTSRLMSLSCS